MTIATTNPTKTNNGADDIAAIHHHHRGHRIAIAFATTLVLWLVVYIAFMPGLGMPPGIVMLLGLVILLGSGIAAGSLAEQTAAGGAKLGLAIAAINLLILAAMGEGQSFAEVLTTAVPWMFGFTIAALGLGAGGAVIGRAIRKSDTNRPTPNWTGRFALVVALTTLVLLKAGGVVTGMGAGLAVPDWLTTFDYPMMFYPMTAMQEDSGVFVEHFHRLWGLLVGLCVIVLVFHLWRVDSRHWVRWTAVAILLMVIIQGVLGGTRVTHELLSLAIVHGIFGQAIFALLFCLAAVTSTGFRSAELVDAPKGRFDQKLSIAMIVLLVLQLTLGALYRHLKTDPEMPIGLLHSLLGLHIFNACIVVIVAMFIAARLTGLYASVHILRRFGVAMILIVLAQFVFGFLAWAAGTVGERTSENPITSTEVAVTTVHQVTGAIILAIAAMLALWTRRLLRTS